MRRRRFEVVPATDHLLVAVAEHARQADIDELWAAAHMTPLEVLRKAAGFSDAWVGLVDGAPICAFGVVPLSSVTSLGSPWMVGTHRLDACAMGFLRCSRSVVEDMLGQWERITNCVDARNTRAIKWLRWLGFTIYPPQPYGLDGMPFHPFEMRKKPCVTPLS